MDIIIEIAGMKIKIDVPFAFENTSAFMPFQKMTGAADTEIEVHFVPVRTPKVQEEKAAPGERYLLVEGDGKSYLGYHFYGKKCHAWMETDGKNVICYYLEDSVKLFPTVREIFYVMCPEHLLNLHHGFILHSSFIRWKGKGILFTAPSGTGKSTQAALWKKYEHADILNGDRSALRYVNGEWRAYGLPFAGSSDIYRNEFCPVGAIVVLEQAKENKLEKLSGGQAFRRIYSQLVVHPWDGAFVERITDDLTCLVKQIPMYRLACRPDRDAVELLKQETEVILDAK